MAEPGPTLLMMAGLPGSGKSTLALALGRALAWPVIDKDTLKATLLDGGIPETAAAYAAYDLLYALARDLLVQQRLSLILDSPTTFPAAFERAAAVAQIAGARLLTVLCLAPGELRQRRAASRVSRTSQPRDVNAAEGDGTARYVFLPADTLRLDARRPVEALVTEVLGRLAERALTP